MPDFDPSCFRFTVQTPESRYAAIKARARTLGLTPGQLVQALFDMIDLSRCDGEVGAAAKHFRETYSPLASPKALADRAARCGLTVRELKVFGALAEAASVTQIVRPNLLDLTAKSGVAERYLDESFDGLLEKGFIAIAPSTGRGRRAYTICRSPE